MQVGGAAEVGSDYDWLAPCVGSCAPDRLEATIPAGGSSVEIELSPRADMEAEPDETITVQVLPSPDYVLATPAETTITLRDAAAPNLPPVLAFATPPQTIYRYAPQIGGTATPVALQVRAQDADGSIARVELFHAGSSIGEARRPRPDFPEDVFVLVWEPTVAGTNVLTAVATDDRGDRASAAWDGLVAVVQEEVLLTVQRGSPVLFGPADCTLQLTPRWPVDPRWTEAVFYQGTNELGRLTSAPWEWRVASLPAGEHRFDAALKNAAGGVVAVRPSPVFVTVHPPNSCVVTLQATREEVTEGASPLPRLVITRHGGNVAAPLTVGLAWYPGPTGTLATLYREPPRAVTIPAGETEARLPIEPLTDDVPEPDTSVAFWLTDSEAPAGAGCRIEPAMTSVTVTIRDDDPPSGLEILSPANGERLSANAPVQLHCGYDDSIPAALQGWVEYRVGGRRFSTWSLGGPLAVDLPAGGHEIQATAHLRDGREIVAVPVHVTVEGVAPEPSVRILSLAPDTVLPLETDGSSGPISVRAAAADLQGTNWQALLHADSHVVVTQVLDTSASGDVEWTFPAVRLLSAPRHVLRVELRTSDRLPRPTAAVAVHVGSPLPEAPLARIAGGFILSTPGAIFSPVPRGFRPQPMPPSVDRWVAGAAATNLHAVDQAGEWWNLSRPGWPRVQQAPRPPGVQRWRAIGGGERGRAAIGDDGQSHGWDSRSHITGTDDSNPAGSEEGEVVLPFWRPPGVTGWKEISTSGSHYAAITEDGRLFAWGRGVCPPDAAPDAIGSITHNGFGPETLFPALVPLPAGVTRWLTCVAGSNGSYFAVGDDGAIYAAGENGGAELDPASTSAYPRHLFRLLLPPGTGRPVRLQSPTYGSAALLAITDNGSAVVWDPAPGASAPTRQPPSPTTIPPTGAVTRWLDGHLSQSHRQWSGVLLGDDRDLYSFTASTVSPPGPGLVVTVQQLTASNRFSPTDTLRFDVHLRSPTNGTSVAGSTLKLSALIAPAATPPEFGVMQVFSGDRYLTSVDKLSSSVPSGWGGLTAGHHALRARAFDRDGFSAISEAVEIVVLPQMAVYRNTIGSTPPETLRISCSDSEFRYALEMSKDLKTWGAVGEVQPVEGTNVVVRPGPDMEFYRLRLLE